MANPGGEEPENDDSRDLRERLERAEAEAAAYRRLITVASDVLSLEPVRRARRLVRRPEDPPAEVV